jgi:hypothetical protein
MRAEFGVDHVQGDTGVGDIEWWVNGGGVRDTDILSGGDDIHGICGAGGRDWRRWRVGIAAGVDGIGWSGVDVPAEAASGIDVCDVDVGGAGVGGLQ